MEQLIILATGVWASGAGSPGGGLPGSPLAAPETVARAFATVAGDLALVLDSHGRILAAAQGENGAGIGWASRWVGRAWAEVVAAGNEGKASRLMDEVLRTGAARAREINLAVDDGHTLGFRCSALRLATGGPVLLLGRDLGAQAALQHQLLTLQQEMEGRYWAATSQAAPIPRRRR